MISAMLICALALVGGLGAAAVMRVGMMIGCANSGCEACDAWLRRRLKI